MDWLPADDTDDWLHLALALGMLGLWAALRGRRRDEATIRSGDRVGNDRVGART
jgi:hypothetical protein